MPTTSDPFEAHKFYWQEGAEELLAVVLEICDTTYNHPHLRIRIRTSA